MKTLIKSIIAGAFIALAGLGASLGYAPVIFPIGLILIVLTGSKLFTGSMLLYKDFLNKDIKLLDMLSSWGIILIGNIIGTLLTTLLLYSCNVIPDSILLTAQNKVALEPAVAFVRGIFCNILVCLAVYLAGKTENIVGKIICVFIPVFLFVLCGFEHSIANLFYIPAGMLLGDISGIEFFNNFIPVILGNIIGGLLVSASIFVLNKKDE